ncbi:MAG: hypothetical protein KF774_04910 [Planctomyces sp.]|nr:hypothetical protein [Planctomyces sp.]
MGGNGSGSFAAILLSIPLSAVALMSVFGVPQLSNIISSRNDDDGAEINRGRDSSRSRTRRRSSDIDSAEWDSAELWSDEEDDLTDPDEDLLLDEAPRSRSGGLASRSSRNGSGATQKPLTKPGGRFRGAIVDDTLLDDDPLADFDDPEPSNVRTNRQPFASTSPSRTAMQDDSVLQTAGTRSSPGTFDAAIQRARKLGVERYHLEQGLSPDTYLFIALVDTAAASGAIHRFEAEARDPIAAVDDVIAQIADWKKSGGAGGRRAEFGP